MAEVLIKNLYKIFDRTEAVSGIDLSIKDKEFVILVGPSGCGKSTVLRMVAGLEDVTKGEIFIEDNKVNDIPPKDRDIAMVFQSYALYPHMTVYENMSFGLRLRKFSKNDIKIRVEEAAKVLGISELLDRRPRQLSGGQRQRVAMGRAIVRRPDVFLFDEPLSNLDAKLRTQMRTEIKKLHQKLKTTIIYVTHDQVEAMTLADRIIIMKDGYIEQIGTPIEVFNNPVSVFVATFIGSPPMNILLCDVIKKDDNIFFKLDEDLLMPCLESKKQLLTTKEKVFVGIRSEDISPKQDSNISELIWSFNRKIELCEPLGTETQLFLDMSGKEIISRMYNPRPVDVGERISFEINLEKVHFFDSESEKALF